LIGCTEARIETRVLVPDVPRDLRTPCLSATRTYQGVADAALIVTDLIGDRDCANSKITATDIILTDAENAALSTQKQSWRPTTPNPRFGL
jgi:hypothetical protein